MSDALEACPFCGSPVTMRAVQGSGFDPCRVEITHCGVEMRRLYGGPGLEGYEEARDGLAKAWNTRAAPPSTAEAQARALVGFSIGLKQQAQQTHSMFSEGLLHAARYAEAEAKRIREEG